MGQGSHPWYADCLSVVSNLAMSQESRKLKRLARQFNLLDEGPDPDTIGIFMRLHEACHHDEAVASAIQLNDTHPAIGVAEPLVPSSPGRGRKIFCRGRATFPACQSIRVPQVVSCHLSMKKNSHYSICIPVDTQRIS
jgi:hypothetical protein